MATSKYFSNQSKGTRRKLNLGDKEKDKETCTTTKSQKRKHIQIRYTEECYVSNTNDTNVLSNTAKTCTRLNSKQDTLEKKPLHHTEVSGPSNTFDIKQEVKEHVIPPNQTHNSIPAPQTNIIPLKEEVLDPELCKQESSHVWEPPLWRQQMANIVQMRQRRDAPVDTMGCDVISDVLAQPQVQAAFFFLKI